MKRLSPILYAIGLAGFVVSLGYLFHLRFEAGDIYPAYSTLRTDPLGTKAFHDGLAPLVTVERNFQPWAKLDSGRNRTLFVLGMRTEELRLARAEWEQLERFAMEGGRVVLSLYPSYRSVPSGKPGAVTSRRPSGKRDDEEGPGPEAARLIGLKERWGIGYQYRSLSRGDDRQYEGVPATLQTKDPLPETLICHTGLGFDNVTAPWRGIYVRDDARPVLMERPFGSGTLVLSADSYFFSNEALLVDRLPELLAWFAGPNRGVVFDETHLGVQEATGVAVLARKYRLHGLVGGLLLLAALFIWKNSSSLVPPAESVAGGASEVITGKEAGEGFINVLRRNVSRKEILALCLTEWGKSCAGQVPPARLQRVQALIDRENQRTRREQDPVELYQEISRTLSRSRHEPKSKTNES